MTKSAPNFGNMNFTSMGRASSFITGIIQNLFGIHIHGDGCEFYKDDEFFIWSWSSIFATRGTIKDLLVYRFPTCVVPERQMRKKQVSRLFT